MAVIEWLKRGNTAIISMNNGENRHNPDFIKGMLDAFSEVLSDDTISAAVLTSGDAKYWSNGIDVAWITGRLEAGDQDAVRNFLYSLNDLFKTMLTCPVPVIAMINGHIAANGLVLACACDFRFMRSDRGLCLFPEVDIGIPFFPGMIEITKRGIPYPLFEWLKYTGCPVTARELEEHGVILKACGDMDDLEKTTFDFAASMNKKRDIFGEMKKRMHKNICAVMESEDPEFIEPLKLLP